MAQDLEQVSDQEVIDALAEHLAHLNYELAQTRERIRGTLKRVDEMYAKSRIGNPNQIGYDRIETMFSPEKPYLKMVGLR